MAILLSNLLDRDTAGPPAEALPNGRSPRVDPREKIFDTKRLLTVTKKLLPLSIGNYTIQLNQGICMDNRSIIVVSPSFPDLDPNRKDNHDGETPNEGAEHEDIAVICVGGKSEELQSVCQEHDLFDHNQKRLTRFIMTLAEILTGTPSKVSTIIRPDPTSFTHRASKPYLRGHSH